MQRLLADHESGKRLQWSNRLTEPEAFACFKELISDRGARYANCTLETFVISWKSQEEVLTRLNDLVDNRMEEFRHGGGLILYGPEGTGKDHLQFAVMRFAVEELLLSVKWLDGMRLQDQIRHAIGQNREHELRKELREPQILAISDPIPPVDGLNQWNLSFFRDVIDRRYQDRRSTWVTFNGSSLEDLEAVLLPPLTARLIESSVVLHCNWPSFRKQGR